MNLDIILNNNDIVIRIKIITIITMSCYLTKIFLKIKFVNINIIKKYIK